jgi:hypothetical protein
LAELPLSKILRVCPAEPVPATVISLSKTVAVDPFCMTTLFPSVPEILKSPLLVVKLADEYDICPET